MTRQETIAEITRRLVDFYRPERIYLFGSEGRGESGPDSDLDFCVVLPDDAPESLYRDRSIHRRFWGLHAPVDVVRLRPATSMPARITWSRLCRPRSGVKGSCSTTPEQLLRNEAVKWLLQSDKDRPKPVKP